MAEVQGVNIRPAQLIELYEIGFKLVPLGEGGKPLIPWTPVYDNPEYWSCCCVEALEDCSKPERSGERARQGHHADGASGELKDVEVQEIAENIRPCYKKGLRHALVIGLSGVLHKSGISKDSAIALVETISKNDEERDIRNAVSTVEETFEKDPRIVAGSRYLSDALIAATGDHGKVKGILDKIFSIIGKGDLIQWLTRSVMNEHTFLSSWRKRLTHYFSCFFSLVLNPFFLATFQYGDLLCHSG